MTSAKLTDQKPSGPQEKLLLSMVEAIQDMILVVDRDFKVVLSNWRGREHLTAAAEGEHLYCYKILKHRTTPCEDCHVREVFSTGQVREVEVTDPVAGRTLEIRAYPVFEGDRVALVVEHVRDITARQQAEAGLKQAHTVLAAVAFAAHKFLQTPAGEENIQEVLGQLGRAAEVSRVYIFENHPGENGELLTSQRFEWAAEGIAPQMDNPDLQSFPWQEGGMGRWQDLLAGGEVVVGDVEDFPAAEQDILMSQGIQSILAVPLFVGREWWGFMGFDECRAQRRWSMAEINALKTAAGIIGTVFLRQRAEKALTQSEMKFRTLVEQIPAITYIAALDEASTTLYISPQIKDILGFTPADYQADPDIWRKQLHPEDRERVLAEVSRCQATGEPYTSEYRMITKGGQEVWFEDRGRVIREADGRPLFLLGVNHDITGRKRMEEELRESQERFRQLFDYAADAIFLHDQGKIVEVNRQACVSLGYSREELLTMHVLDLEMEQRDTFPQVCLEKGDQPTTISGIHRRKDGTTFPVEVRSTTLTVGGHTLKLSLVRDISERRRAEEEIRAHQEMLRSLATELSLTEERERRRLAEDLHDHIGQVLALAKMKLGAMRQEMGPPAWRTAVEEVREFVDRAIDTTRSLTFELSVPILYEVGLEEAVEWLAEQFQRQQGLEIAVHRYPETLPLSAAARGTLFRVVRELLTNVVKHSRARKVSLSLEKSKEKLSIMVKDEGIGFDIEKISSKMEVGKGFGLFSIRERLGSMGGQMKVHSAPGRGTRVKLSVPLAAVLDFQGGKS